MPGSWQSNVYALIFRDLKSWFQCQGRVPWAVLVVDPKLGKSLLRQRLWWRQPQQTEVLRKRWRPERVARKRHRQLDPHQSGQMVRKIRTVQWWARTPPPHPMPQALSPLCRCRPAAATAASVVAASCASWSSRTSRRGRARRQARAASRATRRWDRSPTMASTARGRRSASRKRTRWSWSGSSRSGPRPASSALSSWPTTNGSLPTWEDHWRTTSCLKSKTKICLPRKSRAPAPQPNLLCSSRKSRQSESDKVCPGAAGCKGRFQISAPELSFSSLRRPQT